MKRSAAIAAVLVTLVVAACGGDDEPDAYGNFEASDVVVAAQASGQVQWFSPVEGMQIGLGSLVGLIDTTQLALERQQITAQRGATQSRIVEVSQQIDVLRAQQDIAQRAYARTRRLYDAHAATAQQLDQAERDYRTLTEQIQAVQAQRNTVGQDVQSAQARTAQIAERISRSRITNPVAGTVLATYAKAGEVVGQGQPLYRIADLRTLELRAYIAETQLARVKLGQRVQVNVDIGDDRRSFPGTITWISAQAEFTPTQIQTREERADLVYAIKISVPNPQGILKIGMPADVELD